MDISQGLKELGLILPDPPAQGGIYSSVRVFYPFAYLSGCGPDLGDKKFPRGKTGAEISLEEAKIGAKNCLLNILALIQRDLGSLERIKSFTKMTVFVASAPDFYQQPQVADGASKLLADLFGKEIGLPARSAVGVAVLPDNIPVEIELMFELFPA